MPRAKKDGNLKEEISKDFKEAQKKVRERAKALKQSEDNVDKFTTTADDIERVK